MATKPWRFTIEFDDEKAKRNGYNVDDLYDCVGKYAEQIAKLMETVADSTKAVQGAQALHHETAQTLALESTEQKLSRWQRLRRAWRG